MVKNPPWSGRGTKIPHATEQLSTQATTTELVSSRVRVPHSEAHAATRQSVRCIERSCIAQLTQPTTNSTQPNKYISK